MHAQSLVPDGAEGNVGADLGMCRAVVGILSTTRQCSKTCEISRVLPKYTNLFPRWVTLDLPNAKLYAMLAWMC